MSPVTNYPEVWFDPKDMTIEQFMAYYDKAKRMMYMQRAGQVAMNCLHHLRPDLSERILGSDKDPFYRDSQLLAFSLWLSKELEK